MREIRINLADAAADRKVYALGSAGENGATRVAFDATEWLSEYPDGTFTLTVRRSDGATYLSAVTREGSTVLWTVSSADAREGFGQIELTLTSGELIVKSAVFATDVSPSLSADEDAPEAVSGWFERVIEAAEAVLAGGGASAVSPMTGATALAAGAAGLVPAPGAGDEGKVLSGGGAWIDPAQIGVSAASRGKTFTGATATADLRQTGYRGMATRVKNPGRFSIVRVTVKFGSRTVNDPLAPLGVVHVGVMAGATALEAGASAHEMPYYAQGSTPLTASNEFVLLDIALDSAVSVEDEYLYVLVWCTDGSGIWLNRSIDRTVVGATADLPNYMLKRYASDSTVCTVETGYTIRAAAFEMIDMQNPTESALSALDSRVAALEAVDTPADNPLDTLCPDGGYCNIFHSITCIGDSLTAGTHEHNETGTREYQSMPDYSYPAFMARALGVTVTVQASGGKNAKGHLTNGAFTPTANTDAYVIALGTNDISKSATGMITGALTDINVADSALTDASTDVGAYGKIIQGIQAAVPKAKIFCVTVPHTRNTDAEIAYANALYRGVAALLGCYVIDLETYGVQSDVEYQWKESFYLGGHLNTMGYRQLAVWIMSYIDWIIRHNMSDFAQTAFIQTNYAHTTTPLIVVSAQPLDLSAVAGAIAESLSVTASASNGGTVTYQWYQNATDAATGGTAIDGATGATMALDTALTAGTYYYYCVLSCEGAADVTTACAAVTVTSAAAEPVYLARYTLNGAPNAAAGATLADESGNGNALTVNGLTAYDANGYLNFTANGQSLTAATVNLNGKTKYKMHFSFGKFADSTQNRIFALNTLDVSLQLGDICFQVESSESLGFVSPVTTTNYKNVDDVSSRFNIFAYECDWIVDGDEITLVGTFYYKASLTPYTATTTFTCTGFTAALTAGGICLCNRPDGTRPSRSPLEEFYIVEEA